MLDPARVPKVHAETAAKQNAGLIAMLDGEIAAADRHFAAGRPGGLARQPCESAQRACRSTRSGSRSACCPKSKGDFRLGQALYDQKLAFALFSPLSRQEIRARAESELAATRSAMYEIATPGTQGQAGRPPTTRKTRAPRSSSAPSSAALELANAERPKRDAVLDAARAALAEATQFRAREESRHAAG